MRVSGTMAFRDRHEPVIPQRSALGRKNSRTIGLRDPPRQISLATAVVLPHRQFGPCGAYGNNKASGVLCFFLTYGGCQWLPLRIKERQWLINLQEKKVFEKTRTVPEGTSGYEARQGDRSDTACAQAQGLTLTLEFCAFL